MRVCFSNVRVCFLLVGVLACGGGDPGPACSDVCTNLLTLCTDFPSAECLSSCEDDWNANTRRCVVSARSCSTATSSCLDEGTCGDRVIDRGEQCDDGNTVGGDGCSATCMLEGVFDASIDGCAPGEIICNDECTNTQTDNLHCGECDAFCELDESCVAGVCEVDAALEFILEWDTPGNLDLHVLRPDGEEIYWNQMTPPAGPGGLDGTLDADDQEGSGPERIHFDMPTSGPYQICVNARAISSPTSWMMSVQQNGSLQRVVTGDESENIESFNCTAEESVLTFNLL